MLRRTPLRRGKRKAKPKVERDHHRQVAGMQCLACGAWPVEVHHVISDGFKRITRDHKLVIPLCRFHHRNGPDAVHVIGTPAFEELFGIRQIERARRLWEDGR